jgi:flagellar hook assembly protein FlgD
LKAWDLFNNSSEKEIFFFVSDYPTLAVNQIGNYPNPFTNLTTFRFNPIQNAGNLNVQIKVYTLAGLLVRTINSDFQETNQGDLTIRWDGRGDQGQRLDNGMYVYHMKVSGENGASFQASQKLVILNP